MYRLNTVGGSVIFFLHYKNIKLCPYVPQPPLLSRCSEDAHTHGRGLPWSDPLRHLTLSLSWSLWQMGAGTNLCSWNWKETANHNAGIKKGIKNLKNQHLIANKFTYFAACLQLILYLLGWHVNKPNTLNRNWHGEPESVQYELGKWAAVLYWVSTHLATNSLDSSGLGCLDSLHTVGSTRCWKHPWEIFVHIYMISSHSCCRFQSCESPIPPHPKGSLVDLDLMTVGAIWVQWTQCRVQQTSWRQLERFDMECYAAGSSIRKCEHWMDVVSNNTQVHCDTEMMLSWY